jgi:chorismate synthase
MLRFLTAGESHGQGLLVILEGIPAGLALDVEQIAAELGELAPLDERRGQPAA